MLRLLTGWLIAIAAPLTAAPFPDFQLHVIDRIGSRLGQSALADIDRDGDLDYVTGEADHGQSRNWWWEFQAPDRWLRHEIGNGHTDVGRAVHDVNGDGWLDILAGSKLLLNPGKPREQSFSIHDVGTIHSHDTIFADVNGDGRMDALANSDKTGLYWYELAADPTQRWSSHTIATTNMHQIHGGIAPRGFGDLDGDGDTDVVTGQAWYENRDGRGGGWLAHRDLDFGSHHQYGLAVRTWVVDLDGDGDQDIIQAEADNPDGRVAWFANDGLGVFTRHLIKDAGGKQDFHALAVADFDNDGDLDVFSGGGPLTAGKDFKSFIWENLAGSKASPGSALWREHLIARKHCHEAVAGDVDADGDVDIVFKPWSGEDEHVFLENRLK